MILVVYSGLGLVVRGYINLEVFNILYWVFFVTCLVIFSFVYSPTMGILGAEGMCSMTSMFSAKQWRLINISIPLDWILLEICENMKRKSVRKQCANMTHFAALGGKRRRNMFTSAQTKKYCYLLFSIVLLQDFTLTMSEEILDQELATILNNIMWSLILVFFFALFLPIQHLASSFQRFPELWTKYQKEDIKEFYVRVLEPRRETNGMNTMIYVLECEAGFSYVKKKKNIKKRSNNVSRKRVANYKSHLHTIIEMPDIYN